MSHKHDFSDFEHRVGEVLLVLSDVAAGSYDTRCSEELPVSHPLGALFLGVNEMIDALQRESARREGYQRELEEKLATIQGQSAIIRRLSTPITEVWERFGYYLMLGLFALALVAMFVSIMAVLRKWKTEEVMEERDQAVALLEEVVELKNGKKSVSERRFFPGYVLVEMEMADDTWHLVKHTSKVTGFVGGAKNRPSPISEAEVLKIVHQMQEGVEKPRPKVEWSVGELVRVKEGPFTDFNGAIEDVNYDKSKVRVSVTIFGRATPVELDFSQVEKV